MPETCRRIGCTEEQNPDVAPYCSALHRAFDELDAMDATDAVEDLLFRERAALAKHLRSPEFLASGLGLVIGTKP